MLVGAGPDDHLEHHDAKRVQVRPRVDGLPERLLRRHVLRGAVDHPELREHLPLLLGFAREPSDGHLRDAEVEHLHEIRIALARDEHHVLGLEVAMDDAQGVRAPEGTRDLPGDVHRATELEPALGDDLAQAAALDELEDQEERTVLELSEVRGRRDVRVIDVGGGHGLALEAGDDLGHPAHLRVEDLHR